MAERPVDSETEEEQLERNLIELLNELRVTGTGIQVLFAFLLTVPVNSGYKRLTEFDRVVYFVALLCMATSMALLIAPSVHHRLLFRHRERPFVIELGSRLAIGGIVFLAVGLLAILILISNLVFGTVAAIVTGTTALLVLGSLWFMVPLGRRRRHRKTR